MSQTGIPRIGDGAFPLALGQVEMTPRNSATLTVTRKILSAPLAAWLLLFCACNDSSRRPDPPQEVYLQIHYSVLGWSPDQNTWYFVKELREQRGYTWFRDWFDGSRWIPEVTAMSSIVCAVGADGTQLRELYAIPDLPAKVEWHYTAVTANEQVILGHHRSLYRLGPDGTRQLAKIPRKIRWFDYSSTRSEVVVGDGETGLYLLDMVDGTRRRLTKGRDRHPRWSPDGQRLFFLRWAEDGTADFVLLNPDTEEQRQVLRRPLQRGLSHDDVIWAEPSKIRIGNSYISEPWPLENGFSAHPLGSPSACAVEEDQALVNAPDCSGELPGKYGHFGQMGPMGIFGTDNVAGTVKLLAVEDFRPVLFDSRWSQVVSEHSRCRVRSLFCLDGRLLTIPSEENWEKEVEAYRSLEGQLW